MSIWDDKQGVKTIKARETERKAKFYKLILAATRLNRSGTWIKKNKHYGKIQAAERIFRKNLKCWTKMKT
jgi:hypothetical protein